ncbi:hypothetical protein [Streptomyces sp. NPDC003514]
MAGPGAPTALTPVWQSVRRCLRRSRVDSTWPETRRVAEEHVGGLSEEVAYTLLRANAIRTLDLPSDREDRVLSEAP